MSQTYAAQIVVVLAFLLPKLGLTVSSEELTELVQAVVILGGVLWTLVRRYQAGDINLAGIRS